VMGPDVSFHSDSSETSPKNRFLGNQSSTYVDAGGRFRNVDKTVGGELANDTLTIGAVQAAVTFGVADTASSWYAYDKCEGEFGLSVASNASSPINQILQNLDAPIVSIYIDHSWDTPKNGTGLLTLGDDDTTNCGSSYAYAPSTNPKRWEVMANSLSYGGVTQNVSRNLYIIKETRRLSATQNVTDFIAGVFGATYNSTSGYYEIGCDQVANQQQKTIKLNLAGGSKAVKLTINDFAHRNIYSNDPNNCVLAMYAGVEENSTYSMTIGTYFLRNHCISMNLDTYKMGIGNLKGQ